MIRYQAWDLCQSLTIPGLQFLGRILDVIEIFGVATRFRGDSKLQNIFNLEVLHPYARTLHARSQIGSRDLNGV